VNVPEHDATSIYVLATYTGSSYGSSLLPPPVLAEDEEILAEAIRRDAELETVK
jgi:hypothetical protein